LRAILARFSSIKSPTLLRLFDFFPPAPPPAPAGPLLPAALFALKAIFVEVQKKSLQSAVLPDVICDTYTTQESLLAFQLPKTESFRNITIGES